MLPKLNQSQAFEVFALWLAQLTDDKQDFQKAELISCTDLVGYQRSSAAAQLLRNALGPDASQQLQQLLLPLLGYQRNQQDFLFLRKQVLQPGPLLLRRAALEGVARGLGAWPLGPLRNCLLVLAVDIDPILAATAVDLIARLPWSRQGLKALAAKNLDPLVQQRLVRRRAAAPPSDLLLVVHGRSGGEVPSEFELLAAELRRQRGCRVILQCLTAATSAYQAQHLEPAPLTLVPLFQLPGHHVRVDLPAIAKHWRSCGWPLRRLPFLGAWPQWQGALAQALSEAKGQGLQPQLLHHPLSGALAMRYPQYLQQRLGAPCSPWTAYTQPSQNLLLVPLAVAANRLSEALNAIDWPPGLQLWPPLLQQSRFRLVLMEQLLSLP